MRAFSFTVIRCAVSVLCLYVIVNVWFNRFVALLRDLFIYAGSLPLEFLTQIAGTISLTTVASYYITRETRYFGKERSSKCQTPSKLFNKMSRMQKSPK